MGCLVGASFCGLVGWILVCGWEGWILVLWFVWLDPSFFYVGSLDSYFVGWFSGYSLLGLVGWILVSGVV